MTGGGGEGFDRLRPRRPGAVADAGPGRTPAGTPAGAPADPLGRRALYSVAEQQPALGAVTIDCSGCGETSVVTPRALVGLAVPSLHLPLLRRGHSSWMRCPACRRRTWVRMGLRL